MSQYIKRKCSGMDEAKKGQKADVFSKEETV